METPEKSVLAGEFTLPPGKDVYGELTLSGSKTSLYLRDKEFFSTHSIPDQFIKGVLHDLTKVSLIHCITTSGTGSGSRGKERYHFATVFPHFVVSGDRHLAPDQKTIAEVHFVIDDASTLFYDFDAFGFLIDARPFIEEITKANVLQREVAIGPNPEILFFTGKNEIFTVDTVLGRISASHRPTRSLGGPNGVQLNNTIFATIAFKESANLDESILRTSTLLRYFGMLIGRPQNLLKLVLLTKSDQEEPDFLQVYWSMPPNRDPSHEWEKPHPSDVLTDAVRQPEEFSRVLASWLDRQDAWRDARWRFFNCFAEQNHYGPDRLIGSANMFDILPSSAVPAEVPLSKELEAARKVSRGAFLPLRLTPQGGSILDALGRIGKASLKQKVGHRARKIAEAVGDRFPELQLVTDEAVNCRNFFVHGGKPRFDYSSNVDAMSLFTDTLEFVFAASDLIEAGWDVKRWSNVPTTMSHPFARFRVTYATRLRELKALLPPRASTSNRAADSEEIPD
ncbi:MAG: HEPN domain-containing protein [Candidatus Acidiferrales bacterium]